MVYLHIGEGKAELREASSILGKTRGDGRGHPARSRGEQEDERFGIGPAGENKVRFAVVAGDKGHVCSKNGCGCVMGSKRLKAIVITRGQQPIPVYNKELLLEKARHCSKRPKQSREGNSINGEPAEPSPSMRRLAASPFAITPPTFFLNMKG